MGRATFVIRKSHRKLSTYIAQSIAVNLDDHCLVVYRFSQKMVGWDDAKNRPIRCWVEVNCSTCHWGHYWKYSASVEEIAKVIALEHSHTSTQDIIEHMAEQML